MAIILRMHSLRHMTFPLFVRSCFTLSLTYPSDWFSSFISMPPLRQRCVYSSENNYRWLRESLEVLPFPSWILTLGFLCTRSSSGIRGITFISVLLRSWQGRVAPPTFRVSPGCNFPWPAHDSSLTNGVGTEVKGFATAKHKRENPNYLQRRRSAAVSRRLYLCNNRAADHDFSFSFFFSLQILLIVRRFPVGRRFFFLQVRETIVILEELLYPISGASLLEDRAGTAGEAPS